MQNTSELFKTILKNPLCVVQNKVTIAGTDYLDDKIESLSTYGSMFSSDSPCIGSAVSRTIEVTLKTDGAYIPRAAEIKVFIRLALLDSTGAVASCSEWILKGIFFIDTRQPDEDEQFLTIHGYDAMLKGEQPLVDQATGETGTWPCARWQRPAPQRWELKSTLPQLSAKIMKLDILRTIPAGNCFGTLRQRMAGTG